MILTDMAQMFQIKPSESNNSLPVKSNDEETIKYYRNYYAVEKRSFETIKNINFKF